MSLGSGFAAWRCFFVPFVLTDMYQEKATLIP